MKVIGIASHQARRRHAALRNPSARADGNEDAVPTGTNSQQADKCFLRANLVVVASWIGLIDRSKFSVPVSIPYREDSAMEKFRDDPHYGAAERVHAYIADAYVWETNAMPRNPELELKLRSELESRLSGRTNQQNLPLEALQARGRALLNSRKDHLQALKDLAAIHWIGDAWKEEASLLSNPPKHDPNKELITNLKPNEDGSVDVTTETMAETRVYRVELIEGKWLIRKYAWHSNSQ